MKLTKKELRSLMYEMMLNEQSQTADYTRVAVKPGMVEKFQTDLIAAAQSSATGFGQQLESLLSNLINANDKRLVFGDGIGDAETKGLNNGDNAMFADMSLRVDANKCIAYSVKASRGANFSHMTNVNRILEGMITAAAVAFNGQISGKSVVAGYIHVHAGSGAGQAMALQPGSEEGVAIESISAHGSFDDPTATITFPPNYDYEADLRQNLTRLKTLAQTPGPTSMNSDWFNNPQHQHYLNGTNIGNTRAIGRIGLQCSPSGQLIENGTEADPKKFMFVSVDTEELTDQSFMGRLTHAVTTGVGAASDYASKGLKYLGLNENELRNINEAGPSQKMLGVKQARQSARDTQTSGIASAMNSRTNTSAGPNPAQLAAIQNLGQLVTSIFTRNDDLVVYDVKPNSSPPPAVIIQNTNNIDRLDISLNTFDQLLTALRNTTSNNGFVAASGGTPLPDNVLPEHIEMLKIKFGKGANNEQLQVIVNYLDPDELSSGLQKEEPRTFSIILPKTYYKNQGDVVEGIIFPVWQHTYQAVDQVFQEKIDSMIMPFPTLAEIFSSDNYSYLKGKIISEWGKWKAFLTRAGLKKQIGQEGWEGEFRSELTRFGNENQINEDIEKINKAYLKLKTEFEKKLEEFNATKLAASESGTDILWGQTDELTEIAKKMSDIIKDYQLQPGPEYVQPVDIETSSPPFRRRFPDPDDSGGISEEVFKKYSLLPLLMEKADGDDKFSFGNKDLILDVISKLNSIIALGQFEPLAEAMLVLGGYEIPEGGFFNSIQTEPASMTYLKDASPAQDASFFDSAVDTVSGAVKSATDYVAGMADTAAGYVDDFFSPAGGVPAMAENNHKKYSLLPLLEMMDGGMGPMDPGTVEDPFDVETLAMGDSEERSLYDEILMAPTVDIDDEDDLDSDGDGIPNDEDPEDDSGAFGAVMERFMQKTLTREAKHKIDQDESEEGLSHGALLKKKYYGRY